MIKDGKGNDQSAKDNMNKAIQEQESKIIIATNKKNQIVNEIKLREGQIGDLVRDFQGRQHDT